MFEWKFCREKKISDVWKLLDSFRHSCHFHEVKCTVFSYFSSFPSFLPPLFNESFLKLRGDLCRFFFIIIFLLLNFLNALQLVKFVFGVSIFFGLHDSFLIFFSPGLFNNGELNWINRGLFWTSRNLNPNEISLTRLNDNKFHEKLKSGIEKKIMENF